MELLKKIVYQQTCNMIFDKDLAPGSRLPGEFELGWELGISRVTLRSALSRLEKDKIISRSRQHGTVVALSAKPFPEVLVITDSGCHDLPAQLQMISGVSARCSELGMDVETTGDDCFPDKIVLDNRYIGYIHTGCCFLGGEKLLKTLNRCSLPVVDALTFESDPKISGQTTLLFDASQAWFDGLKHLLQFRHRRIASLLNRKDIIEQLKLREPGVFISSFDRPNLSLTVRRGLTKKEKIAAIIHFIRKHTGQSHSDKPTQIC